MRFTLINKNKIRSLIDSNNTRQGKIFFFIIQFLIVFSLISFSLDTLPDLSMQVRNVFYLIEVITVLIFSVEYLLRIYIAPKKWAFIFSFYGIIDLIAVLPFYISTGFDLRSVRIFRVFRLLRILKLLKYNQAVGRFHRAIMIAKEELVLFSFITTILLYLSAVGIYYFEHAAQPEQFKSIFHSLWWAVTTLTTVGYGDMYPITTGGKVFTFFVLMIGLGVVAVPVGLVASALSSVREENDDKE